MRHLLAVSIVIALLAAPGLSIINVKLTADGPIVDGKVQLTNGQTTTVYLWGQADSGLYSLGGDIDADLGDAVLLTSDSLSFGPEFNPTVLFTPAFGTAGPNGGWSGLGTMQTNWGYTRDRTIAMTPNWGLICQYTVRGSPMGTGDVTLTFASRLVSGYRPLETDNSTTIGSNTPLTIHVTPEPATLVLLTLGGVLATRRK